MDVLTMSDDDNNTHWTHWLLWPISKRLYCRYWSARLSYRALQACQRDGEKVEIPPIIFAIYEFLRPNQTIEITVTKEPPQ